MNIHIPRRYKEEDIHVQTHTNETYEGHPIKNETFAIAQ